jgi:hypothetical protein
LTSSKRQGEVVSICVELTDKIICTETDSTSVEEAAREIRFM